MHSASSETLWFRLAVRGVGILMLAWGLPSFIQRLLALIWEYDMMGAGGGGIVGYPNGWLMIASALVGPTVQIAMGVYLLRGATGLIAYCCRGALGMCPACNYDVRNVPGATCPECGVALPGRAGDISPSTPQRGDGM